MEIWVLLVHVAATLFMTGVSWFVQLVHYPLYRLVGIAQFARYEAAHTFWTAFVVVPPMLAEMATAFWLVWCKPLASISEKALRLNLALLGVIWLSTAFVQSPLHGRLTRGFDERTVRWLVASNWLRTVCWSVRSVLVLTWLAELLR